MRSLVRASSHHGLNGRAKTTRSKRRDQKRCDQKRSDASPPVNKPFAVILIFVSVGVIIDRYVGLPFQISFGAATLMVSFQLIWNFLKSTTKRGPSAASWQWTASSIVLALACVLIGASWHRLHYGVFREDDLGYFASEESVPAVIRAWIDDVPFFIAEEDPSPMDLPVSGLGQTRLIVRVTAIRNQSQWESASGKTSVSIRGKVPGIRIGDEIVLKGGLRKPPGRRSPGGFDLREFLRGRRIHSVFQVGHSENLSRTGRVGISYFPIRSLTYLADHCGEIIDQNFSSEAARLVRAMLLGQRYGVSRARENQFLVTGTMHLLAISGIHVGILASGWILLIRWGLLPEKSGFVLTMTFVSIYCLLVGARPPVIRATVLVLLYCLAKLAGRRPVSVNSLCLAGLTVVLVNPVALFQPGPQLSFVAVAVLIMTNDLQKQSSNLKDPLILFLRRKRTALQRRRDRVCNGFRNLCVGSVGIWIATLPLVVEYFHVVSLIGIITNILLMIPVGMLLNLSFLTLVFGFFGLGAPFAWLAELLVGFLVGLIHIAGQVPGGYWWSFGLGAFWLCVFYALFAFFFLETRFRLAVRWQLAIALVWLTTSLVLTVPSKRRASLVVTFIDVGHGVSVLVEFPNGKSALYDAGCLSSSQFAFRRISGVLWARKISRLDAVIVSHADLDHYNSIPALLTQFKVDRIIVSSKMNRASGGLPLDELNRQIEYFGVRKTVVDSQWIVGFDRQCSTKILHPASGFDGQSDNADSLVIQIEYQGKSVLLTGDLEFDGLDALLKLEPRPVDVLMVPHHGSDGVDHEKIVNWARPGYAVISSGRRDLSNSVRRSYQRGGVELHETAHSGTVVFELSDKGVAVERFCQ